MEHESVVYSIFLVFAGAACLATVALYARLALLVAYIVLGVAFGPWGFGLVTNVEWINDVADIGIMFLLYLMGLNLPPEQLRRTLNESLGVTASSSLVFGIVGWAIASAFSYPVRDAVVIGACCMMSSTIIALKLLPTTVLHHRHTGQVIIGISLLQDLIAIIVLLVLQGYGKGGHLGADIARQLASLPVLAVLVWGLERYLLAKLIARFDRIHEYVFLLVIAWCLAIAELARVLGLSHEIGAFLAGVAFAGSPIARFIAESLRPLRDFFLILFFFSLGASFNMDVLSTVVVPAVALAAVLVGGKALVFCWLLERAGEPRAIALEIGMRLGQGSEFALLVAALALAGRAIAEQTAYLIQLAMLLSFVLSSYLVVLRYPTPIAVNDRLRRD